MDEQQEKIGEILDKVQGLPDSSLIFLGVIGFIILALAFVYVIYKLIMLQMAQNKFNAEISAQHQSALIESNRQTELMRLAFDQHNNLERERNRVIEAQSETIRGIQISFLEKLPQLIQAADILRGLTEGVSQANEIGIRSQQMLNEAKEELRRLSQRVILLVQYSEEQKQHQELIDGAVAHLAFQFVGLEEKVIQALGLGAINALPPMTGSLQETILAPGDSKPVYIVPDSAPDNLTQLGD